MKSKITVCSILILAIVISMFSFTAFAEEEIFDVNISDDGEVSIFYCYPYYRNSQASVVVTDNVDKDIIWFGQFSLNNTGILRLDNIRISKSGDYTVTLFPENRSQSLSALKTYFTQQDKLNLWIVASSGTDSDELAENWSRIETALGINVSNLDYVINKTEFYNKAVSQRTGDLSEKNEENFTSLTQYFETMALLTAIEQNANTGILKTLFDKADFSASSSAVYDSWAKIASEGDYTLLLDIFSQKERSIMSYDDLMTVMTSAVSDYGTEILFKQIKNAVHVSEVKAIISDAQNASRLGIADLYDSYKSLINTASVDEALRGNSYSTKEELRTAFSSALTAALNLQNQTSSSVQKPQTSDKSSGGWYGGLGGGGASVSVGDETDEIEKPFNDTDGYPWAEEHIISLYNLGIISGKGQHIFAPGENITREEMIKLVVCLFKLENSAADVRYSDVEPGSWYEDYVYTATRSGITQGIGDNMFGVGQNASRQDIAVMLTNALDLYGYLPETSSQSAFADKAQISSYAVSAVDSLFAQGIITGDNYNCFNPAKSATRAEVSVMISRIYDKFVKES